MAAFIQNLFPHIHLIAQNTKNNDLKDISIKGQTQTSVETKSHFSLEKFSGKTSSIPSGGKNTPGFSPVPFSHG